MFGCCHHRENRERKLLIAQARENEYFMRVERNVLKSLKDLIELQGFKSEKEFVIYKVPLTTLEGYINTLEFGFSNKPILIMTHGIGGSNFHFYKLYETLSKTFHIYSFDVYGMGASFRYDFNLKNLDEILDLYAKSFEEWRVSLNLETENDVYFLGHSLGGFFGLHWIEKYQPKLSGVFIISSPGFLSVDYVGEAYAEANMEKFYNEDGY